MEKLFKFLVITFIGFLIIGCCTTKQVSNNEVLGISMKYSLLIKEANQFQVDSLIKADTLPSLNYWFTNSFRDYQTNELIVKRTFIKEYNNRNEITYVISGDKEPYCIEKRIMK
jgi:hypothetical protein